MDKHPKSGVYRYRKAVPPELREFLPPPYTGKRELVKSLDTKNSKEAARLHSIVQEQMEQILDAARIARAASLGQMNRVVAQPVATDLSSVMPAYASALAKIASGEDDFFITHPALPLALSPLGNVRSEHVEGPAASDSPASKGSPIRHVFDAYIREKRPSAKTEHEFARSWAMFLDCAGLSMEADIAGVTKGQIREFKEKLFRYPQQKGVLAADCDQKPLSEWSFNEIVDAAAGLRLKPIADKTIQKHIAALSSVLNYAAINDYRIGNPAENLNVRIDKNAKRRLPYESDDLKRIFGSRVFAEVPWGYKQWMPILALYTGCRMEELGQLLIEDLKCEGDVWFLAIRESDDAGNIVKRVKTASSERNIPLHPELARLGFVEYVAQKAKAGSVRIFDDMPGRVGDRETHYFSRWWGLQRLVFAIPDTRKTFHSFRHTFKDACRNAGIPEDVSDALTGHSSRSVGRGYGNGHSLPVLADWISRISYPIVIQRPPA